MSYQIQLKKESFKFSCSHFTIFGSNEGERLHGHNYYVDCHIEFSDSSKLTGLCTDFNDIKPKIKEACDELDERVLLPTKSKYLNIEDNSEQIEVRFNGKFYSFPKEDVLCLPVVNISTEQLSLFLYEKLKPFIEKLDLYKKHYVTITETSGQSATFIKG